MAIPSRADLRARWVALVTAEGSWTGGVYDHQPGTLDGDTKVATVHGGEVVLEPVVFGGGDQDVQIRLLHTNYTRRDDPDQAEDDLDALLLAVAQVAQDNYKDSAGNWDEARLLRTEPDYFVISGQQYRAEVVTLEFTVYQ